MRSKVSKAGLTVQAIAGTHVVLLGMNMPKKQCSGLLGFAIHRTDETEREAYWLSGFKTFESVVPHPAQGVNYSTRQHPVQGFTWSDYSAKPEHDYTYEIIALRGTPKALVEAEKVTVKVTTEQEKDPSTTHHVHFNRGVAASQAYTRRFRDRSPQQVGPAAFDWLSRGAAEAIRDFIGRAKSKDWGLRVGAYEFTDDHVLQSLKDAWKKSKADVKVLYHARNDSQKKANETAIANFGIGKICQPRNAPGLALSHNKTIVLTYKGAAKAVLTGSTNYSEGGIYGHSNVVHICEEPDIAAKYLQLWDELAKNVKRSLVCPILATLSPLPKAASNGTNAIFSPRPDLTALERYAADAKNAKDALFATFAFGMNPLFQDAYKNGKSGLRYALMEKLSGPTKTDAQRKANEKAIKDLRSMEQNKFAVGAFLAEGAFDRWAKEKLSGLNVNVRYLHTKYMLVDPLGENPLVITGSANFSKASTESNDENMLYIRGDKRVADIYLGEFMRLYSHFAFREWLSTHTDPSNAKVAFLDEQDTWWKGYFGTSFASRQRQYFAGV